MRYQLLLILAIAFFSCKAETPRYQFEKDQTGRLMRLDTQTGETTPVEAPQAVQSASAPPQGSSKSGSLAALETIPAAEPPTEDPLQGSYEVPSNTEQIIQDGCKAEWGSNYRMLEYCINQQREAVAKLENSPAGVPGDVVASIRQRCADEWPKNFRMREYCQTQQFESYMKVSQ